MENKKKIKKEIIHHQFVECPVCKSEVVIVFERPSLLTVSEFQRGLGTLLAEVR